MKFKLLIVLCIVINIVKAQDTVLLKQNVYQLNKALIAKDTTVIKQLLHTQVSFGHSNGWVQKFNDVFVDMFSGKLEYLKIDANITSLSLKSSFATCISAGVFEGSLYGKSFSLKLHVMQTWIWDNNKWIMISRQSTKL